MDRARSALRQSLYHLRRSLGETVVVSRGDDEVGLDAGRLWCDAAAMSDALSDGDREAGVELYRGDLLEGFFLPGAPEFERWMEGRREALRESAARAAAELAEKRSAEADPAAAHWARLGIRLTPLDEARVRTCLNIAGLHSVDILPVRIVRLYPGPRV